MAAADPCPQLLSCDHPLNVHPFELRSSPPRTDRLALFSLHHVQLAIPAGGEDRARGFYGDVLGMEEIPKPPALAVRGGAWFRAGGLEIHLGVEEPFAPARKAHPGILTHDLEGLRARLVDAGIDVRPDALLPGFLRYYVDDCFGNRLEFLQPIR